MGTDPTDYVSQLIVNLRGILGDPEKCAEVMRHDRRFDGVGVYDLFDTWESEQWERDNPEEADRLWEDADLGRVVDEMKERRAD